MWFDLLFQNQQGQFSMEVEVGKVGKGELVLLENPQYQLTETYKQFVENRVRKIRSHDSVV